MLRRRSTILCFALLIFAGCYRGFYPQIAAGEAIQLRAGESARIADNGMRFRVDSIVDSRCPADVTCIDAGRLGVFITVMGPDDVWQVAVLGLRQNIAWLGIDSRHRLELLDVQPTPRRSNVGEPRIATIGVGPRRTE